MKSKARILNYDLLRIVAMIGVVLIHVNGFYLYSVDVNSKRFIILNAFTSLVRFSAPAFIMISGAFFLNPKKELTTKRIYHKYISRVLIALLATNLIYILYFYFIVNGYRGFEWIKLFLVRTINGDPSAEQLWYLYAAIWLYMLTPILRKITANSSKKEIEYFLLIGFIFTVFFPTLTTFSSFQNLKFVNFVHSMGVDLKINYILYFFAGYYIDTYWNEKMKKYNKYAYVLYVLSILYTIVGGTYISINNRTATLSNVYYYFSVNVFMSTIAIFIIFKSLKINEDNHKLVSVINYLSSRSFGVYLIHVLLISIFYKYVPNINEVVLVPLFTLFVVFLSLILTEILGLIPFIRKKIFMYQRSRYEKNNHLSFTFKFWRSRKVYIFIM